LGHFDCGASRFGETTTALELAPEGYTFVGTSETLPRQETPRNL